MSKITYYSHLVYSSADVRVNKTERLSTVCLIYEEMRVIFPFITGQNIHESIGKYGRKEVFLLVDLELKSNISFPHHGPSTL